MSETTAFKSCSPAGDTISFIPAMRKHYTETGKKVILYLWLNIPMHYYEGAVHNVKDENGVTVGLNQYMFDMLRPLLLAQDFVEDVRVWQGEEIKIDFDILKESFGIMPYGSLNRYIFYIYPDLACDLSGDWLKLYWVHVDTRIEYEHKIVCNFTERYRNYLVNYFFLKQYENDLVFCGVQKEHELFCKQWNLNIELVKVGNFLELSQIIDSCLFFLGNQSMCFQIAEGLKVPRILERCPAAPNVIPIGDNAYDFHYQKGLEYYFKKLYEQTK